MSMSREQIDALLGMLSLTRTTEPTCEECARDLAEFVEHQLTGKPTPEALEAIEHHLRLCGECHEEFETLLAALGGRESD